MRTGSTWAVLAVVALAPAARAEGDSWDGDYDVRPTRRSGVMLSLWGGLLLGSAKGTPNEPEKLDDPRFEQSTGFAAGSGGGVVLGGAITDWFNFGIGSLGGSYIGQGVRASGGAFTLRLEAYPAFGLGGPWRDFGVLADFGIGGMSLLRGEREVANGGGMSAIGVGAFFEPLRLWRIASGPTVQYFRLSGLPLTSHTVFVGFRSTLFGGPRRLKANK